MSGASPIRLLLTADAVGGVWQYATDLAAALLPLGVQPTIACVGPSPSSAQRTHVPAGVTLVDINLPLDWLADGPAAVRRASRRLAELSADHDVAQVNTASLAAEPFPVPTVAVAHGCLSTWWEAAYEGVPPADMAWQVDCTRAGLRAVDLVVAPTRAFAELVQGHYRLRHTPVAIHNGRRPFARTGGRPISDEAFTAGRLWDRVKNVAVLDDVAGRLAIPFYAAGALRGPHGEAVTFRHLAPLGVIEEAALAGRLQARPVFVSSARFEPFGLAVLEAAQAGCALVLSDISTFRELWNGAAIFVAADDAAGFAVAVDAVIGDPPRRAVLGAAARQRADHYTVEANARAMLALYTRLLATARKAAA